jgi:Leucine-rich repeat (LRR) protein
VVEQITGFTALTHLETLVLSHKYIKKIENLSTLTKLHTTVEGLLEVPTVGAVNLSRNRLETEDFLSVISQLAQLNLLKLDGNPIARS